jgi:hypothetical protein
MLSRLSGIFKREDEKPKPDIKDLLLQVKNLTTEEKQLVRNALDEPEVTSLVPAPPTSTEVAQPAVTTTTTTSAPAVSGANYAYTEAPYKRRQD